MKGVAGALQEVQAFEILVFLIMQWKKEEWREEGREGERPGCARGSTLFLSPANTSDKQITGPNMFMWKRSRWGPRTHMWPPDCSCLSLHYWNCQQLSIWTTEPFLYKRFHASEGMPRRRVPCNLLHVSVQCLCWILAVEVGLCHKHHPWYAYRWFMVELSVARNKESLNYFKFIKLTVHLVFCLCLE